MGNNLKNLKNKVFFVGIGGISMSALATLTRSLGAEIAGSDAVKSEQTDALMKKCKVFIGHNKNNIKQFKPNLVVYTGAIKNDNPELEFAKNEGIQTMERSEFLGHICKMYNNVVAVSGTHGKTTTTAMIGQIFVCAGLNPTIHVGGVCLNFDSNLVVGDNNYFITEACEYKRSFEHIYSTLGVVTNIECDHMDCYQNLQDLKQSFTKFLNNSKSCVVDCMCDVVNKTKCKNVYTFGCDNANYFAKNIVQTNNSLCFDVYENGKYLSNFKLNVMGEYNVKNALVAIAVARVFDVNITAIYDGLNSFLGVERRNEKLGEIGGKMVFADYCHHPTEIANSIKNFTSKFKDVLCVFQPHTYSRTVALLRDFSICFKGVKKLVIFKTYPAREEYSFVGSETNLFNNVKNKNKLLIMDENELIKHLKNETKNYDCVIVLGAGDVYNIVKNKLFENKW